MYRLSSHDWFLVDDSHCFGFHDWFLVDGSNCFGFHDWFLVDGSNCFGFHSWFLVGGFQWLRFSRLVFGRGSNKWRTLQTALYPSVSGGAVVDPASKC